MFPHFASVENAINFTKETKVLSFIPLPSPKIGKPLFRFNKLKTKESPPPPKQLLLKILIPNACK